MNMNINRRKIDRIFSCAEKESRNFLLEPEVYELLKASGIRTPRFVFVPAGEKISRSELGRLNQKEVVVKVVSPLIIHKSDAGGVRVCRATSSEVNRLTARMLAEIPGRYIAWLKKRHDQEQTKSQGLKKETGSSPVPSLSQVKNSIRGFIVVEKIKYEEAGFGSEILVGIRNSPDFGPVLAIGAGGSDVEFMSERLKEGQATAIASVHLLGNEEIKPLIETLPFYGKLALEFRGRPSLINPEVIVITLASFRDLAAAYSPFEVEANSSFVIEEMEVNPFVVSGGKLVPLDGVCRFSRNKRKLESRPAAGLKKLLKPASIAVIGVSEKMNAGRIILRNILKSGYDPAKVFVVKQGVEEIDGCRAVPSVKDLPHAVDLFVLTLAAEHCFEVMKELVEHEKASSVIIIAGGMAEKSGGQLIEQQIIDLLEQGRAAGRLTPVVNGGNSLGIVSLPGRYDTTFIPEYKLPPRRAATSQGLAFVSQSGAFMLCRLARMPGIIPVYAVSLGNQLDLRASDYLEFLKDDAAVRTIAFYLEGFKPGDGLVFARTLKKLMNDSQSEDVRKRSKHDKRAEREKTVIVYKAGRSVEGQAATASHTASVAGDYSVFKQVVSRAGAIVVSSLFEFESFVKGACRLQDKKIRGRRVGLMSNAGFECVVLADNLKNGEELELSRFDRKTEDKILKALAAPGIDKLQDIHNPLDATPVADDKTFSECARAIVESNEVDCAVISCVPMTPAMQTLPSGDGHSEDFTGEGTFARQIIELFRSTDKPLVVSVDSGELYSPLARYLEENGIPVFRRADQAVSFLRLFVGHKLRS